MNFWEYSFIIKYDSTLYDASKNEWTQMIIYLHDCTLYEKRYFTCKFSYQIIFRWNLSTADSIDTSTKLYSKLKIL